MRITMSIIYSKNHEQPSKDDWSAHWSIYAQTASNNPAQKMRHDIILKEMMSITEKPELVMDFGSGQGDFLLKATSRHCAEKYVGLEMSHKGVSISSLKVPEAEFIQVNLFFPPAEVSRFFGKADVAVCSEVIEHVDEPEKFCFLLKTYLKPGGYLFLTLPGGPMSKFDRHIGHRRHYDKASISELLIKAGLNVEKVSLLGFPFFNLYRLMVIVRGMRLISDIESTGQRLAPGLAANLGMKIFNLLFKFNVGHSRFGWQIFAVARSPS